MKIVIEADGQYKNMFLEIAKAIKAKIMFPESDFWDELPRYVKEGILEGQEQIKQGRFSTHEEVMAEYNTKSTPKASMDEKEDTYNPDFVKMVLESAKQKKGKVIDPNNVWGSK